MGVGLFLAGLGQACACGSVWVCVVGAHGSYLGLFLFFEKMCFFCG